MQQVKEKEGDQSQDTEVSCPIIREYFVHQVAQIKSVHYITRCYLKRISDGKLLAQGISICSPLDQYSKRMGNKIARGRAYKALTRGESTSYVSEARQVMLQPDCEQYKSICY